MECRRAQVSDQKSEDRSRRFATVNPSVGGSEGTRFLIEQFDGVGFVDHACDNYSAINTGHAVVGLRDFLQ